MILDGAFAHRRLVKQAAFPAIRRWPVDPELSLGVPAAAARFSKMWAFRDK